MDKSFITSGPDFQGGFKLLKFLFKKTIVLKFKLFLVDAYLVDAYIFFF